MMTMTWTICSGPEVAVVMLSHVNYRTGALSACQPSPRRAHGHGALIIWDLAHSAGALPVDVSAADADFAIGCTYKYLNGGPGSPASHGCIVAIRIGSGRRSPAGGATPARSPWRTDMSRRPGSAGSCAGPTVVSLSLVGCGLNIALRADPAQVRRSRSP